jgi:hypothetical protein
MRLDQSKGGREAAGREEENYTKTSVLKKSLKKENITFNCVHT